MIILNFLYSILFISSCFFLVLRFSLFDIKNKDYTPLFCCIFLVSLVTFFFNSLFNFPILIFCITLFVMYKMHFSVHFLIILSKTILVVSLLSFFTRVISSMFNFLFLKYSNYNLLVDIMVSSVSLLLITITIEFLFRKHYKPLLKYSSYIRLNMFLIISLVIGVFLVAYLVFFNKDQFSNFYLSILICSCLINICLFFYISGIRSEKRKDLENIREIERRNLSEYCSQLEILLDELVAFRHDYINFYSTLSKSLATKNYEETEFVLNKIIQPISKELISKDTNIHKLRYINNSIVKSILTVKFIEATQNNITLNIDIPKKITNYYIDDIDMVRILSILWDNAIDSASLANNKSITFGMFEYQDNLHVSISNTTKDKQIPLNDIYRKNYTTKKLDQNSGIGLYTLRSLILQLENAYLDTSFSYPFFSQNIIFSGSIRKT